MWTIWMWGGFLDLFRRIRWAFHSLYMLLIDISRFLRVWSWFSLQEQREPAIAIFVNAWVSILFAIEGRGCIGLAVSYQLFVLETQEVGPEAYLHCETWCFFWGQKTDSSCSLVPALKALSGSNRSEKWLVIHLTILGKVAIIYYSVAGGPFGTEDVISAAGRLRKWLFVKKRL